VQPAISLLRLDGHTNIAANRRYAHGPQRALTLLQTVGVTLPNLLIRPFMCRLHWHDLLPFMGKILIFLVVESTVGLINDRS
jgi:hypothetical protein